MKYIILLFVIQSIFAQGNKKTDILLYGGKFTDTDLIPIITKQKTDYKESHIGVIGISQGLGSSLRFANFETEFNFVKHFGIMNHWEVNAALIARSRYFWGIPISFAFGEGFSYASENPKLENKRKGIKIFENEFDFISGAILLNQLNFYPPDTQIQLDSIQSRNILNFIMVEVDYGFPSIKNFPRIFFRVHHRSGVFGLYCPPDPACGSNFVSYGIKFSI